MNIPVMSTSQRTQQQSANPSPYIGLRAYTMADQPYFFGRAQETATISANLGFQRLTLLYGPSGVGKSSVLQAGVMHRLTKRAEEAMTSEGIPEVIPVYFNRWQSDPLTGLSNAVEEAAQHYLDDMRKQRKIELVEMPTSASLRTQLDDWSEATDSDILLILDQFEEFFLYREQYPEAEDPAIPDFATQLVQIVNHSTLRVNVLISLREDALSKLDFFKGRIPTLLNNRLSMGHLSRKAADEAICKPLDAFNHEHGTAHEIEQNLVTAILDEVGSGEVSLAGSAQASEAEQQGTSTSPTQTTQQLDQIEAPYLQLVLTKLWDKERSWASQTMRRSTLRELGGSKTIVRNYLDETLDALRPTERTLATRFFDRLVTPSGTKIALTLDDLTKYAKFPTADAFGGDLFARQTSATQVEALILKLVDNRLLNGVPAPTGETRYELFHDVLGQALLDWQDRAALAESKRRERRNQWIIGGLSAALVVFIIAVVLAFVQTSVANQRTIEANDARAMADASADEAVVARETADANASLAVEREQIALTAVADAKEQTEIAQTQTEIAQIQTEIAETEKERAERRARQVLAESLAAQTQFLLNRDKRPGDEALILARDAVLTTWWHDGYVTANAYTALRNATEQTRLVRTLPTAERSHQGDVNSVAFSPDGTMVISGSEDHTVRLWRSSDLNPIYIFVGHTASVLSVGFSPDGQRIVSGSEDSTVRVWDAATGKQLAQLDGHSWDVMSVEFSPDGQRIVSGSEDSTVRVWDAATGKQLAQLDGHSGDVMLVRFSPDGQRIAFGGSDSSVHVWDVATGEQLTQLNRHSGDVMSVGFSPDGQRIVSGSYDDSLRVWDVATGEQLVQLDRYSGNVMSVEFSPDGQRIASGSSDNTMHVWDAATGEQLAQLDGH
ncbi:MAG: PQQ-binding-like beta-propeller repeat protein [Chloroflexota bacterium]